MKETISLRAMMFVQAAVALLIPVYYFVMVTYRLRSNVPLFLAIVLLLVIGRRCVYETEQGLRVYPGLALYDGTWEQPEDVLHYLEQKYGLIRL